MPRIDIDKWREVEVDAIDGKIRIAVDAGSTDYAAVFANAEQAKAVAEAILSEVADLQKTPAE